MGAASRPGRAGCRTAPRPTSSEIRRVASRTSSISIPAESVLATHARPGSRVGPSSNARPRARTRRRPPRPRRGSGRSSTAAPPLRRSSQVVSSSSSSASRIGSGVDARGTICCRSPSRPANWPALRSPSASAGASAAGPRRPHRARPPRRVAAAAGLFSSCASPAARVPRVTSDSRCRTVDSMLRAVSIEAGDEVDTEGEPLLQPVAQRRSRHPQHPPPVRAPRPVAR